MDPDKEEIKEDEQVEQNLTEKLAARTLFIIGESACRARAALEPYRRPSEKEGLESAIRNFLIDFFHATQQRDGVAIEAGTLKIIVDEAASLYSDEKVRSIEENEAKLAKHLGFASTEEYYAWLATAAQSAEKKESVAHLVPE